MTPGALEVPAPAKVNLFLRVLEREASGYHRIETLFQAVSLEDTVALTPAPRGVELTVEGPEPGPPGANLAVLAARAFLDATGDRAGIEIHLVKRIPAGAGLGGGSSDAAAVLRGMNRLRGFPLTGAELRRVGAGLGSDVPFFLGESPLARGGGRGEILTAVPALPSVPLVLVLPPVHVSTPGAYRALSALRDARGWPDTTARRLPASVGRWDDVLARAHNDFEEVVPRDHPEVARALAALRTSDAGAVLLSGSGGACFAVCRNRAHAERVREEVAGELDGWPVEVAWTLESLPGA